MSLTNQLTCKIQSLFVCSQIFNDKCDVLSIIMTHSPQPSFPNDAFNHYNTEVVKLDSNNCQEDENGNLQVLKDSLNENSFALLSSSEDNSMACELASDSINVTYLFNEHLDFYEFPS